MDITLFWNGWEPLVRIVVVATLGYVWLVGILRVTGPRNMAKVTTFDFVLTVTLGSAFGRVITAKEVSIAEVLVAFAVLVGLQWVMAWLRNRSSRFDAIITNGPTLLFHDGRFLEQAMRRHRFNESDIHSAARENGRGSLDGVAAVILQADGTFAVIGREQMKDATSVEPFMADPASGPSGRS